MEEAIESPKEPRSLASLVADSFESFIGTLPVSVPIWALALAPSFFAMLIVPGMVGGPPDKEHLRAALAAGQYAPFAVLIGAAVVQGALNMLALGAVVLAIDGFHRRQPLGLADALSASSGIWVMLVLTQLLAGFWVILGFLCLIVPGVILALRYALVHVAVILEGRSGKAALARSKEIMLSHMGKVVGNLLVVAVIAIVLTGVAYVAVRLATSFLPPGAASDAARQYLMNLPGKIIGTWPLAATVLLFRDLAALHPAAEAAAAPEAVS